MYAKRRSTHEGSEVENFIDNNSEELSPKMFNSLEELAEELELLGEQNLEEKENLQNRIEELEDIIRDLNTLLESRN